MKPKTCVVFDPVLYDVHRLHQLRFLRREGRAHLVEHTHIRPSLSRISIRRRRSTCTSSSSST
jgi:hypothetical protein